MPYFVRFSEGVNGPIATVHSTTDPEFRSTYSRRAYGRTYKARAKEEAESLNSSNARAQWNDAHENLTPYTETREFQRDMED